VIAVKHARLFGGKRELLLLRLDRVDARTSFVQIGLAAMACENGRDFALIAYSSSLVWRQPD
jgi:hypothetical protein